MSVPQIVRNWLGRNYERILPVMAQKGVHLEVWGSPAGRFVGVEFNTESVGFWIKKQSLFRIEIPAGMLIREKEPKGRNWVGLGDDKKGANSNLSGYPHFRGAKLSHLLLKNADDALAILDALAVVRKPKLEKSLP